MAKDNEEFAAAEAVTKVLTGKETQETDTMEGKKKYCDLRTVIWAQSLGAQSHTVTYSSPCS
jgi:hypothetical protein